MARPSTLSQPRPEPGAGRDPAGLQAATWRLTACLLRHAIRSTGRANGSPAPLRGLSEVGCPTPAQHMVLQEDVPTVTEQTERVVGRLELALPAQVPTWRFAPVVEALQALRGVQCTVAVTMVAALRALTRFATPDSVCILWGSRPRHMPGGAPAAGQYSQDWPYPGPACPGRRGLGLPVSGQSQSAPATAPGKAPRSDPGQQLEGPGPALHTVSPAHGHRQKRPSGRGRPCPSMKCLHVGHGQAGGRITKSLKLASGLTHKLERFPTSLGKDAAPVWCNPRRRYETDRYARPSSEAGTRRRQGRWEPTHG